ncbi:MAG: SHOCT domain-containing protein [Bacilli bacterium]
MQQNYQQQSEQLFPNQSTNVDPTTKLLEMKKLLDARAISQEEYNAIKAKLLGL